MNTNEQSAVQHHNICHRQYVQKECGNEVEEIYMPFKLQLYQQPQFSLESMCLLVKVKACYYQDELER